MQTNNMSKLIELEELVYKKDKKQYEKLEDIKKTILSSVEKLMSNNLHKLIDNGEDKESIIIAETQDAINQLNEIAKEYKLSVFTQLDEKSVKVFLQSLAMDGVLSIKK